MGGSTLSMRKVTSTLHHKGYIGSIFHALMGWRASMSWAEIATWLLTATIRHFGGGTEMSNLASGRFLLLFTLGWAQVNFTIEPIRYCYPRRPAPTWNFSLPSKVRPVTPSRRSGDSLFAGEVLCSGAHQKPGRRAYLRR